MYRRNLSDIITKYLFLGKVIIIYGARQVGKTTIMKQFIEKYSNSLYLNCDEPDIRDALFNANSSELRFIIGQHKQVFIDEAQRVKNIGLTLKLIADSFPEVQLMVSGSSAFELSNEINEPLTGRKLEFQLYPFSFSELVTIHGYLEEKRSLEQRLIYGSYPDIVKNPTQAPIFLKNLVSSYLFKDVFEWQQLKKPQLLTNLLKALALQLGSEVSYSELANMLEVRKETIASYIQLLEMSYVIIRLSPFSRNLRNEISRKQKFYFVDLGIRNTIINNFNSLSNRTDVGALWENYLFVERMQRNQLQQQPVSYWFWRTHDQKEIDYIEEKNGKLYAYEFKWNAKKKTKIPAKFAQAYPTAEFSIINTQNYMDFLILSNRDDNSIIPNKE